MDSNDNSETLIFLYGALTTLTVIGVMVFAALAIQAYGPGILLISAGTFLYVKALKHCIAGIEHAHRLFILKPDPSTT
jgi:hypothetical protein